MTQEETEKLKKAEEKRQELKASRSSLTSGIVSGTERVREFVAENVLKSKQGTASEKSFARRVLRELNRFSQTGRVSNWLARQFTKEESIKDNNRKKSDDTNRSVQLQYPFDISIKSEYAGLPFKEIPLPRKFKRRPFELSIEGSQVRIYASTIAGGTSQDLGFSSGDNPPYLLGNYVGTVQGGIEIDEDGNVISRWIEIGGQLHEDTNKKFYVEIGTVIQSGLGLSASNSRYGPIDATICRDWFSNPPKYSVSFSGS